MAHRVRQTRELAIFRQTHPKPQPNELGVMSPSALMKDIGAYYTHSMAIGMRDTERRIALKNLAAKRLHCRELYQKAATYRRVARLKAEKTRVGNLHNQMRIRQGERQTDDFVRGNNVW